MSLSLPLRLEEDLKATNPANYIQSYPHTLDPNWKNKIVVPPYGAFFTKDMVVRDSTGNVLTRGNTRDYVCVQTPLRHAGYENVTLNELTGQETAQIIVIVNENIVGEINYDLRYVGGSFSHINTSALTDALKALQLDTRKVNFEDIEGKPVAYLPAWHITDAKDIMNMGAVCFWLEKIYEAILAGDQKQWEYFYSYVARRYPNVQDLDLLREELSNPAMVAYLCATL